MRAQLSAVVLLMCCWFGKCLQRPASSGASVGPVGEPQRKATDCFSPTGTIKTELETLKKVLNSVLTKVQQSTAENMTAGHSMESQLLQLKAAMETEKQASQSKDEKLIYVLASLSSRVHVMESHQQKNENMTTKQATLEAQQAELRDKHNLLLETVTNHTLLTNACNTKVAALKNTIRKATTTPEHIGGNCSDIQGFKKGQVLSQRGSTHGAFGRDPLSKTEAFYYMDGYNGYRATRALHLYPSEADFINNENARSYNLPIGCVGSQIQLIGGKLFCPDHHIQLRVLVYDLADLSKPYKLINITTGQGIVDLQCKYDARMIGNSFIDIEVDETGLFIIWANAKQGCNFIISKVDPLTMKIEKEWQTPIRKIYKGNAFMVCGKLYVTDSYKDKNSFISHVFDTRNNRVIAYPRIHYGADYRYVTHAHYDPRDKVLYVWDNGHQLRVGIVWK